MHFNQVNLCIMIHGTAIFGHAVLCVLWPAGAIIGSLCVARRGGVVGRHGEMVGRHGEIFFCLACP